jgi:hypothetical protein
MRRLLFGFSFAIALGALVLGGSAASGAAGFAAPRELVRPAPALVPTAAPEVSSVVLVERKVGCEPTAASTTASEGKQPSKGCGNGKCQTDKGETCATCAQDCGLCCGDGTCNPDHDETCDSCSVDCGACYCGNGLCDGIESTLTCPIDCGLSSFTVVDGYVRPNVGIVST